MKKTIIAVSLCLVASPCFAFMNDVASQQENQHTQILQPKVYESSTGNQYKYDLSKPSDQIRYSVDPSAQLHDSINMPVHPSTDIDRSLGQHGGGYINK